MTCGPLSTTGLDGFPLLVACVLAVCLIVAGIVLVQTRRQRGAGLVAALALLAVATLGLSTLGASPAVAADCPTATPTPTPTPVNSLTITQTSVISGMAPGLAPLPIFGTVINNSDDETFITDIVVSIGAVTLSPGAAPGTCGPDDYVLLNPRMPVNEMVAPHGTVTFAGASIGFLDQPWNQDACKNATVELLYVTP